MRGSIHRIGIDFQHLEHLVGEHVEQMKGINVLAVLAVITLGSSVKVAAQAWNQSIPEPAT